MSFGKGDEVENTRLQLFGGPIFCDRDGGEFGDDLVEVFLRLSNDGAGS